MDAEWLALMVEAKGIGLSPEEVRNWLAEQAKEDVQ